MRSAKSAGILLYRMHGHDTPELLLAHPGGPYWAKKDSGAWTIPKGEFDDNEDALTAAKREFYEETGTMPDGKFLELTPLKQRGGKLVYAWAVEGNLDTDKITSNTFEMEWPPRSGKMKEFPEIDKVQWYTIKDAREKILAGQSGFIDELLHLLQI